jgi:hypothetical protein
MSDIDDDLHIIAPGKFGVPLSVVLQQPYRDRCELVREMFEATEESIDAANDTIMSVSYIRSIAIMLGVGPFFNDLLDGAKVTP